LTNPAVDVCMAAPADMYQANDIRRALELGPMNEEEIAWMRRVGDHLYRRKRGPRVPHFSIDPV
jgi:hypothetical protein